MHIYAHFGVSVTIKNNVKVKACGNPGVAASPQTCGDAKKNPFPCDSYREECKNIS